jgi:hypothetical protein
MISAADRRPAAALLLAALALFWAGMLVGVSGLATPVKFSAPSLTLPVALEVGRVTFHLFSRVEWGLLLLLVAAGAAVRAPGLLWLGVALVAVTVLAEAAWLLPALDARVTAIIAGETPPPSADHVWYIVAEGVKLVALLGIGFGALFARRGAKPAGARR